MRVEQVFEIVNSLTEQVTGKSGLVKTDLSNVVDVGTATFDAASVDNYVKKLVDHIGKVVFVNRPYSGRAPKLLMDGWEYGSVLEKIDSDIPDAESNPKWGLEDGQTYNQDKFTEPKGVEARFWNKRVTFQVPFSFADDQVKSAFSNAGQLNAFFSMIHEKIETSFTIKNDALIMSNLGNYMAGTLYDEYKNTGYGTKSGRRAINLLKLYNAKFGTTLTSAKCLTDLAFIKFAALQIKLMSKHLGDATRQFNIGGKLRHCAVDRQRIVMLDQFAESANIYLQSDTFHNEFVKLPEADQVSHWQSIGQGNYEFEDVSSVHFNIKDPADLKTDVEVRASGILATIFDKEGCAVNNFNRRVTNHYNGLGEFSNFWYKMDAQYFNDYNENCVVFFVADDTSNLATLKA